MQEATNDSFYNLVTLTMVSAISTSAVYAALRVGFIFNPVYSTALVGKNHWPQPEVIITYDRIALVALPSLALAAYWYLRDQAPMHQHNYVERTN